MYERPTKFSTNHSKWLAFSHNRIPRCHHRHAEQMNCDHSATAAAAAVAMMYRMIVSMTFDRAAIDLVAD